jgi:hypothetical protein
MKIRAINCIHYDGNIYPPGAEFECRKAAAERLIGIGVAGLPLPELPADEPEIPDQTAEQLELIAAAASTEELGDLFQDQPESEEVATAFAARWAELEEQEQQ